MWTFKKSLEGSKTLTLITGEAYKNLNPNPRMLSSPIKYIVTSIMFMFEFKKNSSKQKKLIKCIYIYIYIYKVCVCVCVCIHIQIKFIYIRNLLFIQCYLLYMSYTSNGVKITSIKVCMRKVCLLQFDLRC
jgi:hypothetical protein